MFDDFNQSPAFQLGKWPGFRDADGIAKLCLSFFVVSVEALHLFDDLAELSVWDARRGFDDEGFRHLGRDNLADAFFAETAA